MKLFLQKKILHCSLVVILKRTGRQGGRSGDAANGETALNRGQALPTSSDHLRNEPIRAKDFLAVASLAQRLTNVSSLLGTI